MYFSEGLENTPFTKNLKNDNVQGLRTRFIKVVIVFSEKIKEILGSNKILVISIPKNGPDLAIIYKFEHLLHVIHLFFSHQF